MASCESQQQRRSVLKQVTLGLTTNFTTIAPSMSLGFSAVTLPYLTNHASPFHVTLNQASWFASTASLATPFGCLLAGPMADRFGRTRAMLLVNVVGLLGWLSIATAYYWGEHVVALLLLGRFFTGFSTGLTSVPTTIYMAEISQASLRGVFCTWTTVTFALGVVVVYILGLICQDNWGLIAAVACAFTLVGAILVLTLLPESPDWLVRYGRFDEAKRNLTEIYDNGADTAEVEANLHELKSRKRTPKGATLKMFTRGTFLRPMCLLVGYFFVQQFAGTFVIIFYAVDIVRSGSDSDILDPYLTIILVALVRLFGTILVSVASRNFGRRPLSIVSGSGMAVCMLLLGVFVLYRDRISSTFDFLPLLLLMVYFLTNAVGFLPMPFTMSAEVYPNAIRGTATGISSFIGYFFNFIIVKLHPDMVLSLGYEGLFLFYGAVSLIGTVAIVLWLPETKGKTLQEIENHFKR